MSTKVYGQFNFRGKVKAIRHVLTPNIGMSYTPDFSDPVWGYYQTYQSDTLGTMRAFGVQLVFVRFTGKRDAGECQFSTYRTP